MASVRIDKEKLNRLIEQRGLTKSDVSREIGYHSNFISDCGGRGKMNMPAVKMLERVFNIKLEEYQLAEQTAEPQKKKRKKKSWKLW